MKNGARQDLILSSRVARKAALVYDDARVGGLMLFAPSGWGKSRLLGRAICHQDALRGVGTVVLDVVGGTIDNALDRVLYLPKEPQLAFAERLRYCNMAGEEGKTPGEMLVTSWPMLAKRYEGESLYATSQRIVDLIAKTDRSLATAGIQGLNRLAPLLTSVAIVLAALGRPLSAAFELLGEDPGAFRTHLEHLARHRPEAKEAAVFLLSFLNLPQKVREERSEVLRNKLSLLKFDPVSRAMFSARDPLIDWEEVAHKGLQVYIDLRNETSDKARELKLFWVWNSLLEYIRSRGSSGREHPPLGVVIDELSFFVRGVSLNTDVICEEFREFVQVRKRNANIWLTAATQEQTELPETMLRACLQIGSHLYGATSMLETAMQNGKRWYKNNPYLVKHWRNVWATDTLSGGMAPSYSRHFVIDREPVFMPLDEQEYLNSLKFIELKKGEWLFAESRGEGELPTGLRRISTNNLDPGLYVNEPLVAEFRKRLMERDGIPVSEVLASLSEPTTEQPAALDEVVSSLSAPVPEPREPEPLPESDSGKSRQPIHPPKRRKPRRQRQD